MFPLFVSTRWVPVLFSRETFQDFAVEGIKFDIDFCQFRRAEPWHYFASGLELELVCDWCLWSMRGVLRISCRRQAVEGLHMNGSICNYTHSVNFGDVCEPCTGLYLSVGAIPNWMLLADSIFCLCFVLVSGWWERWVHYHFLVMICLAVCAALYWRQ